MIEEKLILDDGFTTHSHENCFRVEKIKRFYFFLVNKIKMLLIYDIMTLS